MCATRCALLLLGAVVSGDQNVSVVTPGHNVLHKDVTVGGFVCTSLLHPLSQNARVYYPNAPGKFPLVSFAHGTSLCGQKSYQCYADMLLDIAAAGYVVIVPMSSKFPSQCPEQWRDQIHSIDWAKTSDLAHRIDFSQVGLLGHSMGGYSTYHAAGLADVVRARNIGAAVALHPQITTPWPLGPITNPRVPIFFGTASRDTSCTPQSVKQAYDWVSGVAKVYSEIHGGNHAEPMSNRELCGGAGLRRHTPYAIAMFDCHLKGYGAQCAKVYGHGPYSLCSGTVPMTGCEHAQGPSFEALVV